MAAGLHSNFRVVGVEHQILVGRVVAVGLHSNLRADLHNFHRAFQYPLAVSRSLRAAECLAAGLRYLRACLNLLRVALVAH